MGIEIHCIHCLELFPLRVGVLHVLIESRQVCPSCGESTWIEFYSTPPSPEPPEENDDG